VKFKEFLHESQNITIDAGGYSTNDVIGCIENRFKDVVESCILRNDKIHLFFNSSVDRKKVRKILDHLKENL